MNGHTPGPWKIDESVQSQVRQPNGSKRRRIVCPPDANGIADARLIAAAPEMLEALRNVVEAATLITYTGESMTRSLMRAHAAIAKAESSE